MKILVDSTVWIDFLRATETEQTLKLESFIKDEYELCCCGFVFAEVLQGIRDEKQYMATKRQLQNLAYLDNDQSTFELGASIYRELRRNAITIRNSIDCWIAAIVLQNGVFFLENDRDYRYINQHYPLNLV